MWTDGPAASPPAPLVVVLHGLGDRPEGILPLLRGYPSPMQATAPRAPSAFGQGWTWFSSPAAGQDPVRFCAEIRAASDRIAADLRADGQGRGRKTAVTGFSQGGMLAFQLALDHPDLFDLALPISGFVPTPCLPDGPPPAGAAPIVAFHGEADDRVPFAAAQAAVTQLQALGWDVRLVPYPGLGHQISPAMQQDLFATLASGLQATEP